MLLHAKSDWGALVPMIWKLPWTIQVLQKYLKTLSVVVRKSKWNTQERQFSGVRAERNYVNFALSTKCDLCCHCCFHST